LPSSVGSGSSDTTNRLSRSRDVACTRTIVTILVNLL
jgi:hypothetical protein